MSLSQVFDIAGSGMSAQSIRLNAISSNLANAESVSSSIDETYRSRHPVFSVIRKGVDSGLGDPFFSGSHADTGYGVEVKGVVESDAPLQRRYEPNHPMADDEGFVSYPNVNVVEEMADMISASRSFQTNVNVMETAKTMMQRVISLGQ